MKGIAAVFVTVALCLCSSCADLPSASLAEDELLALQMEAMSKGEKVDVCHKRDGQGYILIRISEAAYMSHVEHGDAQVGDSVPGMADHAFDAECNAVPEGPCPTGMANIDGFCIDRWEAHLQDWSPYDSPTSGSALTAAAAIPQGYISGDVAEAACQAVGKRLCTSSEWLRACRGPESTTYPYGNIYVAEACNEGRALHPVIELFGSDATFSFEQLNDPRLNQLPNSLDPAGSNAACVSAEGVYDMHGNLNEWVADATGILRGGYYVDAAINGNGCSYATTAHNTTYRDYSTGFRCCVDQ